MIIGRPVNTATPEFTIYAMPGNRYLVELDGDEVGIGRTVAEAHKLIKQLCRDDIIKGAGVTETFGRNRQFLTTNRYGFTPYKGA